MDEAAKKMVENVTSSNVAAIVMAFCFMVFIGAIFYLMSRRQDKQDAALERRDDRMMAKFAEIQAANREQWKQTTEHFMEVTEKQNSKQEEMAKQNIELLTSTVETMGVLGASLSGLDRAVEGLRVEVSKKADKA